MGNVTECVCTGVVFVGGACDRRSSGRWVVLDDKIWFLKLGGWQKLGWKGLISKKLAACGIGWEGLDDIISIGGKFG